MINVRTKTPQEIEQAKANYRMGAIIAHGIPMTVCETYLMKKDGTKVDTRNLTEAQIMDLVEGDLMDYANPNGTYKTNPRVGLDSFKLASAVKDTYSPSIVAAIKFCELKEQYGHIVTDLMGSFGVFKHTDKAETITKYIKETNGDFTPVETSELVATLQQLAINEQAKKNVSGKTR